MFAASHSKTGHTTACAWRRVRSRDHVIYCDQLSTGVRWSYLVISPAGLLLKPKFIHSRCIIAVGAFPLPVAVGLFKKLTSFFPVAYRGNP